MIAPLPVLRMLLAHLNPEAFLATITVHTLRRAANAAPRSGLRARGIRLLARWCANHFTRPLHHRLGAFDLARSEIARELLANNHR
jgi:hypothetical protein